jgi:hypothetical protein
VSVQRVPSRRHRAIGCGLAAAALLATSTPARAGAEPPTLAARPPGAPATSQPRPEVLDLALRAFACGRAEGAVQRPVLALIDYSRPSTERRLWLIDPASRRVLRSELVAHGRGSGELLATRFSNEPGSHRSSLGLFVTGEAYDGRHGRSLRLHGLEPGVNDAAYDRAVVMHGAWYATEHHAAQYGRLGRSHGCPAVAPGVASEVLGALAEGAALFVYGDDPDWLESEPWARCGAAAMHSMQAQASGRMPSSRMRSQRSRP